MLSLCTLSYPLTDHLCRMRHVTGQNKAALARYDYAPYGELMRTAGLPLTVGYTGSPNRMVVV